jgi:hypothetical protein
VIDDNAYPSPERAIVCGLFAALLVTVTCPLRFPVAAGENRTVIVQLAPLAKFPGQLFVCEKSPLAATTMFVRLPLPVFVSVEVAGPLVVPTSWFAKVTVAGVSVAGGGVPLPVSASVCGLLVAPVVTVRLPDLVPVAAGANCTLTVHVPLAGIELPQVFVCGNSAGALTPLTVTGNDDGLLNVAVITALVAPTITFPKLWLAGVSVRFTTPVPLSPTGAAGGVAFVATARLPLRAPVAAGVNVTLMVQVAPAATLDPHVWVAAKSPLAVTEFTASATAWLFFSCTLRAADVEPTVCAGKVRLAGLNVTGSMPVPSSATLCGDPGAFVLTRAEPVLVPAAAGVKVIVSLHLPPAASVAPQLCVTAKSPVADIPTMLSGPVPLLVTSTCFGPLVVNSTVLPFQLTAVSDRLTAGPP